MDWALLLATRFGFSLLPVVFFLAGLVVIDSYKLVRPLVVVGSLAVGLAAAVVAYPVNSLIIGSGVIEVSSFSRYVAPIIEEVLKGAFLVYLIRSNRIGFVVDAAIHGFAIGAGFALFENLYYLTVVRDADLWTWIVRGFGTAVMHGGTTAIFGMVARAGGEDGTYGRVLRFIYGFLAAAGLHALFNHFLLPPVLATALLLAILPPCFAAAFYLSERSTREWLDAGFDTDQALLRQIQTGEVVHTRVGQYLTMLRRRFSGPVVVDMLCLLRLHAELSIRAKGVMMMRQAGFSLSADPSLTAKFQELRYLERSIGPTGMLAVRPILHTSSRSLWQLNMLSEAHAST